MDARCRITSHCLAKFRNCQVVSGRGLWGVIVIIFAPSRTASHPFVLRLLGNLLGVCCGVFRPRRLHPFSLWCVGDQVCHRLDGGYVIVQAYVGISLQGQGQSQMELLIPTSRNRTARC